jgi:hypothetical protein
MLRHGEKRVKAIFGPRRVGHRNTGTKGTPLKEALTNAAAPPNACSAKAAASPSQPHPPISEHAVTDAPNAGDANANRRAAPSSPVSDGCAKSFRPDRRDNRFCSNACRQAAYRRRQATGEPPAERPMVDEGTHLENVAGVLHYAGTPTIAINRLRPGWPGYGNRYVMAFPRIDDVSPEAQAMRLGRGVGTHLIECATCRRWSITRRLVYCSPKCALKARADEVRARRRALSAKAPVEAA